MAMTKTMSLISLTTLGMACSYRANSFQQGEQFPPAHQTAGCLDVGIGAHRASRDFAPVVRIALGNRCDDGVRTDLSALVAWGVTREGHRVELVVRDPDHQLTSRELAAAWAMSEGIELRPAKGDRVGFAEVCVDLANVAPGLTAKCFNPE